MALSEKQHAIRRKGIGASDARTIMFGDAAGWMSLYDEKINGTRPVFGIPQQYLMDMGTAIEPLTMRRFALEQSLVATTLDHMVHWKTDPFFFFTPDGITEDGLPVQAKFHTGDKNILDLADYYMPQLQHEMLCMGTQSCWLAVTFGHYGQYQSMQVPRSEEHIDAYLQRAMQFKFYMETGLPPEGTAVAPEAAKVARRRDHVWMEGDNEIKPLAVEILDTYLAAHRFEQAMKKIKQMVPKDAASATWRKSDGNGIQFKADRAGKIRWTPIFGA